MAVKIGILSSQRGYHSLALEEAARKRGCEPIFYTIHHISNWIGKPLSIKARGESVEGCRALLVRTIPTGSLEQILFRMNVLRRMENLGIKVINSPLAIERSVDKYNASFLMADAGILTPRTLVSENFDAALEACREMGDVILKPLFGSEGKGMTRVADEETAYRVLRAWEMNRYIFYVQEFIPHFNQDVRAFVIGNKVAAAMIRKGNGWKTNYSQGATVERIELSAEMESLAVKAARLFELDYAGVDLLTAEDGKTYVIEINSIPGWRGLQKTSAIDIPELIIDYALAC
jgi:ribosomal protein S6--L-glutamate ligase/tetrahydromethanopterin:alpha-L-glutamate ligase